MNHDYTFNGQRQGEKVVSLVKNHPYILFFPGLKSVLLLVFGITVYLFWSNQVSGLILIIIALVAFGMYFRVYYNYSQSVFVITNLRVINVEQKGFWNRKIIESELKNIQDVSSSMKGMAKVMLKFGDLIIRTAGASQGTELVVKNISNPYLLQQKIVGMNADKDANKE